MNVPRQAPISQRWPPTSGPVPCGAKREHNDRRNTLCRGRDYHSCSPQRQRIGAGRIRTDNPLDANQPLSQLELRPPILPMPGIEPGRPVKPLSQDMWGGRRQGVRFLHRSLGRRRLEPLAQADIEIVRVPPLVGLCGTFEYLETYQLSAAHCRHTDLLGRLADHH